MDAPHSILHTPSALCSQGTSTLHTPTLFSTFKEEMGNMLTIMGLSQHPSAGMDTTAAIECLSNEETSRYIQLFTRLAQDKLYATSFQPEISASDQGYFEFHFGKITIEEHQKTGGDITLFITATRIGEVLDEQSGQISSCPSVKKEGVTVENQSLETFKNKLIPTLKKLRVQEKYLHLTQVANQPKQIDEHEKVALFSEIIHELMVLSGKTPRALAQDYLSHYLSIYQEVFSSIAKTTIYINGNNCREIKVELPPGILKKLLGTLIFQEVPRNQNRVWLYVHAYKVTKDTKKNVRLTPKVINALKKNPSFNLPETLNHKKYDVVLGLTVPVKIMGMSLENLLANSKKIDAFFRPQTG